MSEERRWHLEIIFIEFEVLQVREILEFDGNIPIHRGWTQVHEKKGKGKGEKRKKESLLQLVATQVKTHQGPQSSNFAGNSSVEEAIVRWINPEKNRVKEKGYYKRSIEGNSKEGKEADQHRDESWSWGGKSQVGSGSWSFARCWESAVAITELQTEKKERSFKENQAFQEERKATKKK